MSVISGSCVCKTVKWTFDGDPESATACNCTACRRYGVLWIYDYDGQKIKVSGETKKFSRGPEPSLSFNFCSNCGSMISWRALAADKHGRFRIAVNLRLADDPDVVQHLPIDHFDGLDAFDDLPRDERTVRHMWF